MAINKQWRLARTPTTGWPTDEDFLQDESAVPDPGEKQALTRTIYLSLDPYQGARRRSGLEAVGDVVATDCAPHAAILSLGGRTCRQQTVRRLVKRVACLRRVDIAERRLGLCQRLSVHHVRRHQH